MKHITLSNSLNFFASAPTWNVVRIEVVELNDTKLKTTTKNGWATEIRNKLSIYRWSQTQLNMVLTVHHFFPCYPCRCCCCTRMTKKKLGKQQNWKKKKTHTMYNIKFTWHFSRFWHFFQCCIFFSVHTWLPLTAYKASKKKRKFER